MKSTRTCTAADRMDKAYEPSVSIIVAVYNAEQTIAECLHSLLALDYPVGRSEIIVVNNGSTDGTAEIMRQYEKVIRSYYEPKRGPAAARNTGIRNSATDVVALTDADCTVDPRWLKELVQPLRTSSIGIVGGKILSKRPCNAIEAFGEKIHDHQNAIEKYKTSYVITMNWAARRSLLIEFGHFDESFLRGSDSEFSLRVAQSPYRFVYASRAIIYHRNETNLGGLFHEGYIHGLYSNKLVKIHHAYFQNRGHRRFNWLSYKRILNTFKDALRTRSIDSVCDLVFNVGKKVGKWFGSIRFMYADL